MAVLILPHVKFEISQLFRISEAGERHIWG